MDVVGDCVKWKSLRKKGGRSQIVKSENNGEEKKRYMHVYDDQQGVFSFNKKFYILYATLIFKQNPQFVLIIV